MWRQRAVAFLLLGAISLAVAPVQASDDATSGRVPVRLSASGRLLGGGETAQVRVGTLCMPGWEPLEAFVYLVQDGNQSQYGFIPIACDGVRHVYMVEVATGSPFHDGEATGTAYVLLMDQGGQTRSGGDTRTVTLSAWPS